VAAPSTTMATVEGICEFGDNAEHLSNGLLGPLGIEVNQHLTHYYPTLIMPMPTSTGVLLIGTWANTSG